jgi:hypothetical protein
VSNPVRKHGSEQIPAVPRELPDSLSSAMTSHPPAHHERQLKLCLRSLGATLATDRWGRIAVTHGAGPGRVLDSLRMSSLSTRANVPSHGKQRRALASLSRMRQTGRCESGRTAESFGFRGARMPPRRRVPAGSQPGCSRYLRELESPLVLGETSDAGQYRATRPSLPGRGLCSSSGLQDRRRPLEAG